MSGMQRKHVVWLARAKPAPGPSPFADKELGECSALVLEKFCGVAEEEDLRRRLGLLWDLYEAVCDVALGCVLPRLGDGRGLLGLNSQLDLGRDLRSVLEGPGFDFLPERLVDAPRPVAGSTDAAAWRAWTLGLTEWMADRGEAHELAIEEGMDPSIRRQIECNWYEVAVVAAAGICCWAEAEAGLLT